MQITKTFSGSLPNRDQARALLQSIKPNLSSVARHVDKPLILYGAGNLGKMAKQYFDFLEIPAWYVVDKNPEQARKDPFWKDTEILGADEEIPDAVRKKSMLVICIATVAFSEIAKPLREQGWNDIVPFYDITEAYKDRYPLSNGWQIDCLRPHIKDIEPVMYQWEDDISRAHYLQFIAWHSAREEWIFEGAPVTTDNRYFIPEVLAVLHDHEVFVDIGAHHGEVIQRFIQETLGKYDEIYAFEPDGENFKILYNNLKAQGYMEERTHLSTKAVGAENGKMWFIEGLSHASQFSILGDTKVDTVCLDGLIIPFGDKSSQFQRSACTFIKIHVEGWEGDVIRGGMETIKNNRPMLAVTSYHNKDGLWHLPAQMMTMLDDYAFYFRLHAWQGQGSVIYAIPREREA